MNSTGRREGEGLAPGLMNQDSLGPRRYVLEVGFLEDGVDPARLTLITHLLAGESLSQFHAGDPERRTEEGERLILPLRLEPRAEETAFRIFDAIGGELCCRFPIHDTGPSLDFAPKSRRTLLLRLVQSITTRQPIQTFRSPRKVTATQVNSIRFQAKTLASALRELPADVRLLLSVDSSSFEDELMPTLDRLTENASAFLKEVALFPTRSQLKLDLENTLAFSLALHGVPLKRYRQGVLAKVLAVAYKELGLRGGGDPFPTLKRLTHLCSAEAVRTAAEQRRAVWRSLFPEDHGARETPVSPRKRASPAG